MSVEDNVQPMKAVPHDELCDKALEHYEEISDQATHYSSLIPAAIKFYKEHYVRRGERKIVYTPGKLEEALEKGWRFDPWLSSRGQPTVGGPITIDSVGEDNSPVYWVLVKGTPEQIAALEPFVELPVEEGEEPEQGVEPYGLRTMFISYNAVDEEGKPVAPPEGYVVMHKDHIFAKGTVYTLPPGDTQRLNRELLEKHGFGIDAGGEIYLLRAHPDK